MFILSDDERLGNSLAFFSLEEATEHLNKKGFSYVDVDGWTQEDEVIWSQYQFTLEYI